MVKSFMMVAVLLLCSCSNSSNMSKAIFTDVATVNFQLPFEPIGINAGWMDGQDKADKGYFYFGNTITRKEMFYVDTAGKVTERVSLKDVYKADPNVSFAFAYATDTFIAVTTYSGHALFFTKAGVLLKKIQLPNVFDSSVYESLGPTLSVQPQTHDLFYLLNLTASENLDDSLPTNEYTLKYYQISNAGPVAMRYFNCKQDSLKYSPIGKGVYNRFVPNGYDGSPFHQSCVSEKSFYFFTPSSDSIYKYTAATGYHLVSSKEVKSANNNTRLSLINITNNDIQDQVNDQMFTKAFFRDMRYDKYRHYIYLSFYHEAPKDAPASKQRTHRPWSILVFDENLNPMGEHVFAADTYDPDNIITTPKGLFIKQITNDYSHGYPYTLFEVHG